MFQTHNSAKINFPSEEGFNLWSYAELPVNQTWFFATCQIRNEIGTISSTYLLSKSDQIMDLNLNHDISIVAVYIFSPPISNIRNSWKFDQLKSLKSGFFEDVGSVTKVEIYDLADGNSYYSSSKLKDLNSIKNITVIYDIDNNMVN
ncbi:MAG: hypothetical protein Q8M10_12715 [Methylotenera sp.]|uniref:hypothetical protein n=1 Tax=Methylotenera sp. TaxID=2051956 RepID=UPI00273123CE|nr:hypothetical protein [Methylotenera sp.]MDP1524007.1 hypothetical protein [Methylotenera sp.]